MDLDADMTQRKVYNVTMECVNVVKFVHTLSNTLQTSGSLRNKGRQLYHEINQVTIAIPNDVGTVLCTGGAKKGLQETVSDDKSNRGPVALSSASRISHLANPPRPAYTLVDRPTFEGVIPFSFFLHKFAGCPRYHAHNASRCLSEISSRVTSSQQGDHQTSPDESGTVTSTILEVRFLNV